MASIHKGETIAARVDLTELWQYTAAAAELAETKKQLARVLGQLKEAEE